MRYDDFRQMPVWQTAFRLLTDIYRITKNFPSDERFGLISDMRRAANSIVHNIAEGFGRYESRDKTRFYKISRGSCYEVMSQLLVSFELKYMGSKTDLDKLIDVCKGIIKDLNSIIKTLETKYRVRDEE